ncbi:S-layer homology domain-containing protein [Aquimarina amphilecti]|uniref:S-layer homology domain-containing protein n=1 Tax=Aquimarina amphilecti TaxID=1038014 RepID=A0A1H7GLW3_AQUAM|nr:M12 family metallopeptidase [Aquimarina amphilecti]SEK39079.1 S-layer homology domain-containing protein [Aquimarina amphilecti]
MRFCLKSFTVVSLVFSFVFFSSCDNKQEELEEIGVEENVEVVGVEYYGEKIYVEKVDGNYVMEGDILIDLDQNAKSSGKMGVLWPNGIIYYNIASDVSNSKRQIIFEAMNHWKDNTVIKFQQRTSQNAYVNFVDKGGCKSFIGRRGRMQELNVGGCFNKELLIHELGHAVGLYHEHNKYDRDKYIRILWDNIDDNFLSEAQYKKNTTAPGRDFTIGVDFESVMIYRAGVTDHSIDITKPVMEKLDGTDWSYPPGTLSANDIRGVNLMYANSIPLASDISGNWAQYEINLLMSKGLVSGFPDGTFKPNDLLTRAQFATLIASIIKPEPIRDDINFPDVPDTDYWATDAISIAVRGGYISGFPDGTFRLDEKVSRVQIWVSLASGLRLGGGINSDLDFFSDREDIPDWAIDNGKVADAYKNKLISVYNPNNSITNKLRPNDNATRADALVTFHQALVFLKKVDDTANRYLALP